MSKVYAESVVFLQQKKSGVRIEQKMRAIKKYWQGKYMTSEFNTWIFAMNSMALCLCGIMAKAQVNIRKHDGVAFEQAAQVFFDPLFRLVDASRSDEAREAVIGHERQIDMRIIMRMITRILFHGR